MNATLTAPAKFDRRAIALSAWSLVKTAGKTLSEGMKAAWAAAKQTIKTTMSTILATIEKPNIGFTDIYDIFHVGQQNGITTAFAMSRPLDTEDVAQFFFLTSRPAFSRDKVFTIYNGVELYRQDDVRLRGLDNPQTQQAYSFTAADVAAFKQAANL